MAGLHRILRFASLYLHTYRNVACISRGLYAYKPVLETGLYTRQAYTQDRLIWHVPFRDKACMHPTVPPQHPWFHTIITYRYKRRFPVRFRVLTGLTHATLRADCGSCVLARLMHATGLCATGGCRIQASTRDRLVHKSGLCTRHYGNKNESYFLYMYFHS